MEGTGAIMGRKTRERAQDTVHMRGRTSGMGENLKIIGITDVEVCKIGYRPVEAWQFWIKHLLLRFHIISHLE